MISFFNNNIETTKMNININETEEFAFSKIIITNSMEQIINKDEELYFQIVPINSTDFYLENNEIIFVNDNRTKFLYLKYCQQLINNNMTNGIKCIISNNIMKGNYTDLAVGQNISILPGQIKLIGISSTGGFFSDEIFMNVNTNAQLNNFHLTFNILYYNSSIKPGYLFPHKVYLYGVKKIARNLEETKYNSEILFPNCTAGNYFEGDSNAIGSIICNLPDYIPAGTYTKLKSNGFDINPNSKIIIFFQQDFKRNSSSEINGTMFQPYSHSSKSMTLIIVLINGILFIVMIVLLIIYCKRKNNKEDDNYGQSNSSINDTITKIEA